MLNLTYEYKLAPTLEQAAVIEDWLEICRKVYNHALAERKDWARPRKCPINACSIDREYIIPAESPQRRSDRLSSASANHSVPITGSGEVRIS